MAINTKQTAGAWTASGGPGRAGLCAVPVQLSREPVRRVRVRGAVQGSVVLDAQGCWFVADMAGWVHGFRAGGGGLWERQVSGGVSASPAMDEEGARLFVGTHEGWVYGLSKARGEVLWQRELGEGKDARILSDLLYVPGQRWVVLSSWNGRFHALDGASGETRHTWDAGVWPQCAATADAAGNVYCLRAVPGEGLEFVRVSADGRERRQYCRAESGRGARRTVVAAAPVLDGARGVVYFVANGDRGCELHAWSLRQEEHLWKCDLPHTVMATGALSERGGVLLADMAGFIRAVGADGSGMFEYGTGTDYLLGGVVCSRDGAAFAGDTLGRLLVIDGTGKGEVIFESARSIQARPAFDRYGNLYLPSTDRTVYVFENRERA